MTTDLIHSPGRGPSGKLRNFKAMSGAKLADVIADLESFEEDTEALDAALAAAGLPPSKAKRQAKPRPVPTERERSDDPLGIAPAKIPMKALEASSIAEAVAKRNAILEPKLDGHRLIVHRDSAGVHLYAGSGVDKTRLAPHIAAELEHLPPGTWLDGEAIVGIGRRKDGGNDAVQSILGSGSPAVNHEDLKLKLFDLITLDGTDARSLTLENRIEILDGLVQRGTDEWGWQHVSQIDRFPATQAKHESLIKNGYEGSIVKWLDTPYVCRKRGGGWFKIKDGAFEDVIVIGYEDGKNSFTGLIGAIRFGQFVDGDLTDRGSCSGMDMKMRREITKHRDEYLGRVFEIGHKGRYPTGAYRSPQWKRWRDDKLAEDCIDQGGPE